MNDDKIVVTAAMRRAVLQDECLRHGHEFDVVVDGASDPTDVLCRRCGRRWPVVPSDRT